MDVDRRRHPGFAAEELIDRHPGQLSLDIPQRHIDPGQRVVQHRSAPPVGREVGGLEDVLDIVHIAADHERFEVLLDRRDHRLRPLGKGRAADAIEPRLGRFDLDDHQPDAIRRGQNHLHIANPNRILRSLPVWFPGIRNRRDDFSALRFLTRLCGHR